MSYKAIVADDNPRSISTLRKILEDANMKIYFADNGIQLLELARSVEPDIIFLDIMMPKMDGFDTCKFLKNDNELKDIPIIMVTSRTSSNDLMTALDLGAFDYIKKPIDVIEAIARIKSALNYKVTHDKIKEMAMKDGLTGVYNRRVLIEELQKEYQKQARKNSRINYIMIDVDHFKLVNDTYGHVYGDEILKKMADIITSSIRISDVVGRYGGEEFGVIIPEVEPLAVLVICEKIRNNIEGYPFFNEGECVHITVSIGADSRVASMDNDFNEMIKAADKALYVAKANGRNRVEVNSDVYEKDPDKPLDAFNNEYNTI